MLDLTHTDRVLPELEAGARILVELKSEVVVRNFPLKQEQQRDESECCVGELSLHVNSPKL